MTSIEDIKFLLAFAPATHVDQVTPDLMPMLYLTGSYEGDVTVVQRVQDIMEKHNIDVNSIEEIQQEEE